MRTFGPIITLLLAAAPTALFAQVSAPVAGGARDTMTTGIVDPPPPAPAATFDPQTELFREQLREARRAARRQARETAADQLDRTRSSGQSAIVPPLSAPGVPAPGGIGPAGVPGSMSPPPGGGG
ncbi:hypothetical protein ABC347_11785 [Sphingomonas sp. 1P06PA]|uniref:hypothetical protein n=1 Tax=Sphingomonas sp. 1P06PA TaxID=554121 RepID=UPI0039A76FC2